VAILHCLQRAKPNQLRLACTNDHGTIAPMPSLGPRTTDGLTDLLRHLQIPRRSVQSHTIRFPQEQPRCRRPRVLHAHGRPWHGRRPTTAGGTQYIAHTTRGKVRGIRRSIRPKEHTPSRFGKYNYIDEFTSAAQISAARKGVRIRPRSPQQGFQGSQVGARQERPMVVQGVLLGEAPQAQSYTGLARQSSRLRRLP
jgi:hypothetical protein